VASSRAEAIDDSGEIAGQSNNRPAAWLAGVPTDLTAGFGG
jgi:hypothetical protein